MKQTGMMFKGPLVLAILQGRKTQTRRIIKDQQIGERWVESRPDGKQYLEWQGQPTCSTGVWDIPEHSAEITGPFGLVGDLIYARETWQHANFALGPYQEGAPTFYRADYLHESDPDYADAERTIRRNWLPSIHMPKSAARIWLEITGVRVERLQDISTEDCIAEGLSTTLREHDAEVNLKQQFKELWESTGADWSANPWVWVYDFKLIEPPAAH